MPTQVLIQEPETQTITIPKEIQEKVDERGFYLYHWITPTEVKASIERDYLSILSSGLGIGVGILGILGAFIGGGLTPLGFVIFFSILGVFYSFVLFYLSFVAIKRSFDLTHNANVVITDTALSVGGKVIQKENLKEASKNLRKIGETFDEPLFGPSHIENKKGLLMKEIQASLGKAWSFGSDMLGRERGFGSSKNNGQLILVALVLGLIYTVTLGIVYFGGLLFIWLFSIILTGINKFILRLTGHKVQLINDAFESIYQSSIMLHDKSKTLASSLKDAQKHQWKDNLLGNIKSDIEVVNTSANTSINTSKNLKELLLSSEYKDIFNFGKYGNWIKKEILSPLSEIKTLLENNHTLLSRTLDALEKQIKHTSDPSLKNPLELQKKRLEIQKQSFEKYITLISSYLEKLKI